MVAEKGEGQVPVIAWVFEREDDEHEQCAGDEFAEELACLSHEWLRVSAEYACCCVGCRRDGAEVVPLGEVDCRDVV